MLLDEGGSLDQSSPLPKYQCIAKNLCVLLQQFRCLLIINLIDLMNDKGLKRLEVSLFGQVDFFVLALIFTHLFDVFMFYLLRQYIDDVSYELRFLLHNFGFLKIWIT